jgi:hypothetical protein
MKNEILRFKGIKLTYRQKSIWGSKTDLTLLTFHIIEIPLFSHSHFILTFLSTLPLFFILSTHFSLYSHLIPFHFIVPILTFSIFSKLFLTSFGWSVTFLTFLTWFSLYTDTNLKAILHTSHYILNFSLCFHFYHFILTQVLLNCYCSHFSHFILTSFIIFQFILRNLRNLNFNSPFQVP